MGNILTSVKIFGASLTAILAGVAGFALYDTITSLLAVVWALFGITNPLLQSFLTFLLILLLLVLAAGLTYLAFRKVFKKIVD